MKPLFKYRRLIVLGMLIMTLANVQAQKKDKKVKIYKVWVKLYDNSKHKGYLFFVDDGSVNIVSKKNKEEKTNIKAKDINTLMLKRKGKGWRNILYGFLGATLATEVALLATNADGENSYIPNEVSAILTGVFLGAPIGALVGSKRRRYNLLGNEELFRELNLGQYAIVKSNGN